MQERRNSSVLSMEFHLSCINPPIWDSGLVITVSADIKALGHRRHVDDYKVTNVFMMLSPHRIFFLHYWSLVKESTPSVAKVQWCRTLTISLLLAWTVCWTNEKDLVIIDFERLPVDHTPILKNLTANMSPHNWLGHVHANANMKTN